MAMTLDPAVPVYHAYGTYTNALADTLRVRAEVTHLNGDPCVDAAILRLREKLASRQLYRCLRAVSSSVTVCYSWTVAKPKRPSLPWHMQEYAES